MPCYFDDIEVANPFNGEWGAIEDFNARHQNMKIARTGGHHEDVLFGTLSSKIYTLHDFSHPQYGIFTGEYTKPQLELK